MISPTFPHLPPPFPYLTFTPDNHPHPHLYMGCGVGVGAVWGFTTFPHHGAFDRSGRIGANKIKAENREGAK